MPKKSSKKISKRPSKKTSKRPSKKTSKRPSKKTSKRPSKKTSRKPSRKTSRKTFNKVNVNKIILDNMIKNENTFNKTDYQVFDVILQYRSYYEFLIKKSLEYEFKLNINNFSRDVTNIDYYLKVPDYQGPFTTNMNIVGIFKGNTFTWNKFGKELHYTVYLTKIAPYIKNNNTLLTMEKLFTLDQIIFSEKYRNVIPYLISMMYDTDKANIIRFYTADGTTLYAWIQIGLDVPYHRDIVLLIKDELDKIDFIGGSQSSKSKNIRLIKNDDKGHINKINSKKIEKLVNQFNNN